MSTHCILITCTDCDYTSKWRYNISRHMMRKHPQQNVSMPQQNVNPVQQNVNPAQQNVNPVQQNVNPAQQNVNPVQQNVNPVQQNVNPVEYTPLECDVCNKIFTKQWLLHRHKKTCNGINDALTCIHCKKIFASRQSKYKHNKTCTSNPTIQNITNNIDNSITNINNTTNNTLNTINNNITNNIITYNPVYTELMPITSKNIDKIQRLIKCRDCTKRNYIMDILRKFIDYSLSIYQNRFVIKNNLRSSYSKVHCGNNNWHHFMDKVILPKITNSIIGSFQELLPDVCNIKKYTFMNEYIDEMYSHGDLKYNSDACKDYTVLQDEIRLKLYDLTKDMKNFNPDFNQEFNNSIE